MFSPESTSLALSVSVVSSMQPIDLVGLSSQLPMYVANAVVVCTPCILYAASLYERAEYRHRRLGFLPVPFFSRFSLVLAMSMLLSNLTLTFVRRCV